MRTTDCCCLSLTKKLGAAPQETERWRARFPASCSGDFLTLPTAGHLLLPQAAPSPAPQTPALGRGLAWAAGPALHSLSCHVGRWPMLKLGVAHCGRVQPGPVGAVAVRGLRYPRSPSSPGRKSATPHPGLQGALRPVHCLPDHYYYSWHWKLSPRPLRCAAFPALLYSETRSH